MSEPQIQIECPRCGHIIATAPSSHHSDVVCPGCGAVLDGASGLDRLVMRVRTSLRRALRLS